MSRLNELIQEYCPDGVEYKKLNTICQVYDGTHSTPHYTDHGVKFASVENINDPYDSEKYISEEDFSKYKIKPEPNDVLMTRIGTIGKCYVIDKEEPLAYYVSLALLRPNTDVINSRFLKYAIESGKGKSELYKRTLIHAVPIKINKDDIGKIELPIPPLPVQQEIVDILDAYTTTENELETQLQQELEQRVKQYKYYLDLLMKFDDSVEYVKLEKLFPNIRNGFVGVIKPYFTNKENGVRYLEGTNIHNGMISDNEELYVTKEFHQKHIKNELKPDDILMVQSGHIGECAVVGEKYAGSNCHALIIMSNGGNCNSKFYGYYFHSSAGYKSLAPAMTGGTVKHVLAKKIKNIMVPFPSVETQDYIVSVLDNFNSICTSLTSGLPSEISLRKKQYEYYRDKLLSFKRTDNR